MKISELICLLEARKEKHGDVPVVYTDFSSLVCRGNRHVVDIDEVSFHKKMYNVSTDKTLDGILLY